MFLTVDSTILSLLFVLISSTSGAISPEQLAAFRASDFSNAPLQLQDAQPATVEAVCPASGLVMRMRRRSTQLVGPGRHMRFDPTSTAEYKAQLPPQLQIESTACYTFLGLHGTCGAGAAESLEKAIVRQPRTETNHDKLQLGNGFYVAADNIMAEGFGEKACRKSGQSESSRVVCAVYMETVAFENTPKLYVPYRISHHAETRGLWYNEEYLNRWKKRNKVQADPILFAEMSNLAYEPMKDIWQLVIPESQFNQTVVKCSNVSVDLDIPYPTLMDSPWNVQSFGRNPMPNPPIGDNLDLRK
ncbi:hypothetical protein BKA69DRAFT_1165764 [Paraphysoderma sedebokerense]|nr:hypothetical protein BKA69DRAFT_1165764 [Paraphysoderma sedebokerense]